MSKSACTLAAMLVLTGCATPTGPLPPAHQPVAQIASPAMPHMDDLTGAVLALSTANLTQPQPTLRVQYPDQRAVIARVLTMIAVAQPLSDTASRHVGDSPMLQMHLAQGGGFAIAPAYDCKTAPESAAPADCHQVEGQVTYFPPGDAKPVRLRSPELVSWLEGGWKSNWPVASAPETAVIKIDVRDGTSRTVPPVAGAEVTFESESGARYQARSDAEGKAELTVPVIPVVTATGSKRCAAYRVTVSAPTYTTEVIDSLYISPWLGMVFAPLLLKGDGTRHVADAGAQCIPDQQPGL